MERESVSGDDTEDAEEIGAVRSKDACHNVFV